MNPLDELERKAGMHPELKASRGFSEGVEYFRIEAPNSDGFAISLQNDRDEWTLYFGDSGAHQHFSTPEVALEIFALALSQEFRMREIWRESFLQKIIFERRYGAGWTHLATNGVAFWPFWRKKHEVVRMNRFLPGDDD